MVHPRIQLCSWQTAEPAHAGGVVYCLAPAVGSSLCTRHARHGPW